MASSAGHGSTRAGMLSKLLDGNRRAAVSLCVPQRTERSRQAPTISVRDHMAHDLLRYRPHPLGPGPELVDPIRQPHQPAVLLRALVGHLGVDGAHLLGVPGVRACLPAVLAIEPDAGDQRSDEREAAEPAGHAGR